ncbi:MAG: LptF/LptG family permease [Holosporaceae bacterium]
MISTWTRYITRLFLSYFASVLFLVSALVTLAEFIELQRRAVPFSLVDKVLLALMKMPQTLEQIFPLLIFLSALLVFGRLSFSNEYLVLNNAGRSIWQVSLPFLGLAFVLGALNLALFQPLSVFLLRKNYAIEAQGSMQKADEMFRIFSSGLWIKKKQKDGYFIAHIQGLHSPNEPLKGLSLHVFSDENKLKESYFSNAVVPLKEGLLAREGWRFSAEEGVTMFEKVTLPFSIDFKELFKKSFKPELIYFFSFPSIISFLHKTGVPVRMYAFKWQQLWASLLECVAFTLLAAAMGLQFHQRYGSWFFIFFGCVVGFVFYFMTQMLQAFGAASLLTVFFASWMPSVFICLFALLLLLFLEEGQKKHY